MQRATRQRILDAAARLHAEHGALGTSYAMIADEAGVSTQTVYNHFPDLGRLVTGCTGHVQAQAPAVDHTAFAAAERPEERLTRLVAAVYRQLEFLSPWLRLGHGDAEVIPELARVFADREAELRSLIDSALGDACTATPEFMDVALVLLDYPAWQTFTRRRPTAQAARLAADCLIRLLPHLTERKTGAPR